MSYYFKRINLKSWFLTCLISLFGINSSFTQSYPFELPDSIIASISVNTKIHEPFNNKLLSVNIDWPAKYYKKEGYNHPQAQAFIKEFNPVSIRWPQGVWANFYDWEVDGRRRYDDNNNREFIEAIEKHPELEYGFDGFKKLHDELNFDVLWTFNLNYDSIDKTINRLRDREAKGFNISHIELGNEQFWKSQTGSRTNTAEKYTEVAQSISQALKAEKSTLKLGIPLSWRRGADGSSFNHDDYNKTLTADTSYFDAIIVHRYVHLDRGEPIVSDASYQEILTSRVQLQKDVNYCRSFAPNKPVWLSEWGVSCGKYAASYLGMADAYLYLFENQDVYEYANWFQINGTNIFFNTKQSATGEFNYTTTGFGAVYEILRDVFQNSTLLETKISTHQLVPDSDALISRAVVKDEKIIVFAVNKTSQSVPLKLKFNNKIYKKSFKHESLKFKNLEEDRTFEFNTIPLIEEKYKGKTIILPPYSINKISNLKI
ncbi:hypothetical protein [Gelidibacter salicanalis]|uniref:Alpha-L-arabinofuranosidase n=1 Tax=Gelidibacter salicanalis TaxID=291193 RepID=A0A934KSC5_9FLAO|nr:hypothetical protein [Gelidibacter salicanalis]MBJ7880526.1 hypothetical protein [Gelidibacter salicanalis]